MLQIPVKLVSCKAYCSVLLHLCFPLPLKNKKPSMLLTHYRACVYTSVVVYIPLLVLMFSSSWHHFSHR